MPDTKPLTDAISQVAAKAGQVVGSPEVKSSVRSLGEDLAGLGRAVVAAWKDAQAPSGTTAHRTDPSAGGQGTSDQPPPSL